MPPEPSLLLAVAETTPQEWLLAFFALASFVLLGFWAIAGQRIRAGVVQGARADYARRLLSRFRLGMESRIGEERSPASVGGGAAEDGQASLLAYASIAEALCGGYAGIFYVDLETGTFAPFRSDGHHARLTELAGQDFFGERVQTAVLAPIHPEDEPALREAFRRERILAATEGGRVFAMSYRYVGSPGGEPVWYEARASRAGGHLVVGVASIDKRMRREKGHEARAEESIARLEELLAQAARSRDTLGRLATYEDAAELRAVALRETGLSLGAVAAYLCRHRLDGTTPIVGSWAVSPERDVLPRDAAQAVGAPDYLDSHPDILYVRGQAEGNDPVWDSMLEKAGATRFLAGLLRVEGEVWGHVAYLVDRPGPLDEEEVEQFREACALVQIGVLRAKLLDARETHREQLVASARAANQAARAKTMFLATMSHEIRTPLNAIIGYSEFLERPGLAPGEIREYTSGIAQSANALLALINDILDLSKLESGRVDMDGRCDLGRLFDELASLFHYRAVTKDLRLGYSMSTCARSCSTSSATPSSSPTPGSWSGAPRRPTTAPAPSRSTSPCTTPASASRRRSSRRSSTRSCRTARRAAARSTAARASGSRSSSASSRPATARSAWRASRARARASTSASSASRSSPAPSAPPRPAPTPPGPRRCGCPRASARCSWTTCRSTSGSSTCTCGASA